LDGEGAIAAPIVGRDSSDIPTSTDVHLYVDPETFVTDRPILYADCEGFGGGERESIAASANNAAAPANEGVAGSRLPTGTAATNHRHGTPRPLEWRKKDSENSEERRKRSYAVSEMFPRILYAFSDVIVYVVTNQR